MLDVIDKMHLEQYSNRIDNQLHAKFDEIFRAYKKATSYYAQPDSGIDLMDLQKKILETGKDTPLPDINIYHMIQASIVRLPSVDMARSFYYSQRKNNNTSVNVDHHIDAALSCVNGLEIQARLFLAKQAKHIMEVSGTVAN